MERSWPVPHGDPIELEAAEQALVEDLKARHASILDQVRANKTVDPADIDKMGKVAHDLHMLLAGRSLEPKHHKYMLKNRGVSPRDPEFYRHVHSVEDLIRFVGNPHANDDAIDVTLDHEFEFQVYSRRWNHDDRYRVTRTKSGWTFKYHQEIPAGRDARVGRKGGSGLFHLLNQDSVNYPEELPGYFEWLWEQAAESGLSHDEVQSAINELATWISACERASPAGVFKGYK